VEEKVKEKKERKRGSERLDVEEEGKGRRRGLVVVGRCDETDDGRVPIHDHSSISESIVGNTFLRPTHNSGDQGMEMPLALHSTPLHSVGP